MRAYLDRLDQIIINAKGIHHNSYLSSRNSLHKLPRKCIEKISIQKSEYGIKNILISNEQLNTWLK